MNERMIRQPNGRIIGRIRDTGDRIEARTAGGVLIGWYCKNSDWTRYADGRLYCLGNGVQMLI
jgi:hypothetical protein